MASKTRSAAPARDPRTSRFALEPDPFRPGAVELLVDGHPQSHVDTAEPRELAYDYVRRIGTLIDVAAPMDAPIRVLHLGGGAMTLPRYTASTRPGSQQLVVEIDPLLVAFVAEKLPPVPGVTVLVADAAEALARDSSSRARFDLAVVDVYTGTTIPRHLTTTGFVRSVIATLAPGGVAAVNVADDRGLTELTRVASAFSAASAASAAALAIVGPTGMLRTDGHAGASGNAVVVYGSPARVASLVKTLLAAGPHPVTALDPGTLGARG